MEVEKVLPDKVERNYYVEYKPYHEFFYMSDQGPEDVAIFITWNMAQGDRVACKLLYHGYCAQGTNSDHLYVVAFPPHGAASLFTEDCMSNPRESIEVRLMVFFET